MILKFSGGVDLPEQSKIFSSPFLRTVGNCRVGIEAKGKTSVAFRSGDFVAKGTHIANIDGTPIFAPVAGVFEGVLESNGKKYIAIKNSGESDEVRPFKPETKELTKMSEEYLAEKARIFSVCDSRTGRPLWQILAEAVGKTKKLVIDCTETDPLSATNFRLCTEKTKSLVGGAKMLIKAVGAQNCIFVNEYFKKDAIKSLDSAINDKKLLSVAPVDAKYPYNDTNIVRAIFVLDLKLGSSALDNGILIVGAETAVAFYDSVSEGIPQTERYISACDGEGNGYNLKVPKGVAIDALLNSSKLKTEKSIAVVNSRINGKIAERFLSDDVRTVISLEKKEESVFECISCGKCVSVCPVGLSPYRVIGKREKTLVTHCIACGCCEYICPSNIPLLKMISPENGSEVSV